MISDDTITSLRNCFKHNKIERSIKFFGKSNIFKCAQKMKRWCFPLLVISSAAFIGMFSFALLAPITLFTVVPFITNALVLAFVLSVLGIVVFRFLPEVLQEIEKIINQNDKNLIEQKEQTVALLQELHTYSLPLKTKNTLNMVVAQLADPKVSSSTWNKVNQCLRKIQQESNQLVMKVEQENSLHVSIKNLERKFKPIDYNVMQL